MVKICVLIGFAAPSEAMGYTCNRKYSTDWLLRMQVHSKSDVAGLLRRLVAQELRSRNGPEAWDSFLRAHATLVRRLEVDLAQATGLALADFDVLAQLARAGGELRMTDLADRVLVSRSGMTRRVARLVEEGLVRRGDAAADGRGVVVALTDAGVARLTEAAPVHLRGVSELFVGQLDDQELAVLKKFWTRSPSIARLAESRGRQRHACCRAGRPGPARGAPDPRAAGPAVAPRLGAHPGQGVWDQSIRAAHSA